MVHFPTMRISSQILTKLCLHALHNYMHAYVYCWAICVYSPAWCCCHGYCMKMPVVTLHVFAWELYTWRNVQRLMSSIHQAGGTILANFKGTFNSSAAKVSRQYAIMLGKPILVTFNPYIVTVEPLSSIILHTYNPTFSVNWDFILLGTDTMHMQNMIQDLFIQPFSRSPYMWSSILFNRSKMANSCNLILNYFALPFSWLLI